MKIIVDIKGGLGNQMFCYAFGYATSKKNNTKLWLDTAMQDNNKVKGRNLEIEKYNICFDKHITYKYRDSIVYKKIGLNRLVKILNTGVGLRKYKEKKEYEYDPTAQSVLKNTYFEGYWQNYRYFDEYRDDILKLFSINIQIPQAVLDIKNHIESAKSVSIHIRRTDYIGLNWQIPMDYYDNALQKIDSSDNIYVFSDDMAFAKEYFMNKEEYSNRNIYYVEYENENRTIFDMYLMSICKNNIIANSSYSWWAAYLNSNDGKKIICPIIGMWKEDIYPKSWERIYL